MGIEKTEQTQQPNQVIDQDIEINIEENYMIKDNENKQYQQEQNIQQPNQPEFQQGQPYYDTNQNTQPYFNQQQQPQYMVYQQQSIQQPALQYQGQQVQNVNNNGQQYQMIGTNQQQQFQTIGPQQQYYNNNIQMMPINQQQQMIGIMQQPTYAQTPYMNYQAPNIQNAGVGYQQMVPPNANPQMTRIQEDKNQDLQGLHSPSCGNYSQFDSSDRNWGICFFIIYLLGLISLITSQSIAGFIVTYIIYTLEYSIKSPVKKLIFGDIKTLDQVNLIIEQARNSAPSINIKVNAWTSVRRGKGTRRKYILKDHIVPVNFRFIQDQTGSLYPEILESGKLIRIQTNPIHTYADQQSQNYFNQIHQYWIQHANTLSRNNTVEVQTLIGGIQKDILLRGKQKKGMGLTKFCSIGCIFVVKLAIIR